MSNGLNTEKKKVLDVTSVEQCSDANTCSPHTAEINWNSCTEDDFMNSDRSPQEVTEAIHHLKANKAVGPGGIIPEIYKHAGDKTRLFLFFYIYLTPYLHEANTLICHLSNLIE